MVVLTPDIAHSKSFDSRWPKLACIAHIEKAGETYSVAAFHLDNVSESARPQQAKVLIELMKKYSEDYSQILLGNANDLPSSNTMSL